MSASADVQVATSLASLAPPLVTVSDDKVFNEDQWAVLFGLLEVFVPSIRPPQHDKPGAFKVDDYEKIVEEIQKYAAEGISRSDVEGYLAASVLDAPGLQEAMRRRFLSTVPQDGRAGLSSILKLLNTTAGSLLLTGSTTPIHKVPLPERITVIRKWSKAYTPLLRKLHNTFANLSKQLFVYSADSGLWKLVGYPGPVADDERRETYKFNFRDFSDSDGPATVNTDVVIVGSGPGSGAVTLRLAEAGLKCLVLEKGKHWTSDYFPMSARDSGALYENGGAIMSDDASIAVAGGSNFGGGGTVNWLASLQPPHYVREEWHKVHKLPHAVSNQFQESIDYVCQKMGVAGSNDHDALSKIKHNRNNEILLEGSRKVGLEVKIVPQNTGGRTHDCGHCHMGCPSCTKQGPANLWFPQAAQHGAEFVVGCYVEKILFAEDGKTAVGVQGEWTSPDGNTVKKLTVKAKRVIIAGGPLNSPLVLQRSGLTNPLIGKNLHVHPVTYITAVMPERINPWKGGGILTSVVTSLKNGNGDGYGPVLEVPVGFPTMTGLYVPLNAKAKDSGIPKLKVEWSKLAHTAAILVLQRDQDSGEVYADKHNPRSVRVKYTPSQRDRDQIMKGQLSAAKILYSQGALEISAIHPDIDSFVRSPDASEEVNFEAFEHFLEEIRTKGVAVNPEPIMFHVAHLFSTCKMGGSADLGVVDGKGHVWGYKNLWVADSSVLPTATSVNPMVTTMGTADYIGRGIVEEWKREKN
jgi:choline dehydrogenase-like flavoprotein